MRSGLFGDLARVYEFQCTVCKQKFPLVGGDATKHMLNAHGKQVEVVMVLKDQDGYHKDVG